MRQLFIFVVGLAILGTLLFGCGDGAEGPAGPTTTGTVIGYVQLANEDHSIPAVRNGVTVTVSGSGVSAISDSSGRFVLNGVPVGTLDFTASKSGYADSKVVSIPFTGGAPFYLSSYWGTIWLDHLPSFDVSTAVAAPAGSDVAVTGTINTTASWYRYVLLYVSKHAGVVTSNPSTYEFFYSAGISGGSNAFGVTIYQGDLSFSGFATGDTVFISAYPAGGQFYNTGYVDATTGEYVYTCVGTLAKNTKAVMP